MRRPDYPLIKVTSGREALACLLEHEFAVVLLDVMMPDMNGFETAQAIRQQEKNPNVPIIFITAVDKSEQSVLQGYALQAIDYIFKPLQADILRTKVAVLVDLYRKTRQVEQQATLLRKSEQHLETLVTKRTAELKKANERLKALSQRLVEVQKAERRTIARELHDEVGQMLTGLKLVLDMSAPRRAIYAGPT